MVEFREEIIQKPPFLLPFVFALVLGTLAGILVIWLRLAYGYHIGLLLIGVGAMCGWGTRLGNGDFSSALLSLAMVQFLILLTIGSVELARGLETSFLSLIVEVFRQGNFTGFLNQCLSEFVVRSGSVKSLIFAYPAAYGVYKIGRS